MTQRGTPPEVLRGVVEATNERGIKLGGRWLNYSQFRQVPHPEAGQEVEVEVVRDRFINALSVVGGAPDDLVLDLQDDDEGQTFEGLDVAPTGDAPPPDDAPPPPEITFPPGGPVGVPAPVVRARYVGSRSAPDRNTEIRRLALLKAAADFAATRPDLTPDDVLAVARQWETWVIERDGPRGERPEGQS
jgi:hypothetical protein